MQGPAHVSKKQISSEFIPDSCCLIWDGVVFSLSLVSGQHHWSSASVVYVVSSVAPITAPITWLLLGSLLWWWQSFVCSLLMGVLIHICCCYRFSDLPRHLLLCFCLHSYYVNRWSCLVFSFVFFVCDIVGTSPLCYDPACQGKGK